MVKDKKNAMMTKFGRDSDQLNVYLLGQKKFRLTSEKLTSIQLLVLACTQGNGKIKSILYIIILII